MNVTVFSSSTCAICHAEMQWLDKEGVSYDKVVVDEDEGGMERMMQATGGAIQGTPFTVVENNGSTETVTGFDRAKLQSLLALN